MIAYEFYLRDTANPIRNSSGALNPAGIIIKPNPAAEQRGIISNGVKGDELVGILPERRKDPARITQESVLHWAETVLGNSLSNKDIYFIKVTINEDGGNIFPPTPFFVNQKKVKK